MTHSPHRLRSKATSWAAKFQELQQQGGEQPEPGFHTTKEWAKKIHRSAGQTLKILREAVDEGGMEMRTYSVMTGETRRPVPHYRLVKSK